MTTPTGYTTPPVDGDTLVYSASFVNEDGTTGAWLPGIGGGGGWQVSVVAAVHYGSPNTVDLVGSTSGVPCLSEYSPSVGDTAVVAVGIGTIPGFPSWGTTGMTAVGTFTAPPGAGRASHGRGKQMILLADSYNEGGSK
jgi:hypothetical protein